MIKFLQKAKRKVSLEDYVTIRTKGIAEYFFEAETVEEIISALKAAHDMDLPFFILGGGSNTIFPSYYNGVVILMKMSEFEIKKESSGVYLLSQAGAFLPRVARKVTEEGGVGMEWAAGVPGTIGGAIRGNAGAFDTFINSFLQKVETLNVNTFEKNYLSGKECFFNYRESIFKKRKDLLILSAEMKFPYGEEAKEKMEEILRYRQENHPSAPSAGSFFKNPQVKPDFFEKFPEMKKFKEKGFIPAAFLIEKSGMKGKSVGGAQVSTKHANFIINKGGATYEDIVKLTEEVKEKVKENFGISLKEEVEFM